MKALRKQIQTNTAKSQIVNEVFLGRYPRLPNDYKLFLNTYALVCNEKDTTWFLSIADFNEQEVKQGFPYNEFELQSLAAFNSYPQGQSLISKFWDAHLPIVLSVDKGYAFFALGVADSNYAKVYFGQEPEYEDVVLIAESFTDFFEQVECKTLAEPYQSLF